MNGARLRGVDVSRETLERLADFETLIRKWNPAINLISKKSVDDFWNRHIVDSAQIFPHIPISADRCLDIGSGAGLPGIVLALLSAELSPKRKFVFVEVDQRKATFLREVVRTLGISAGIESCRVETLRPFEADLLTARALAPLSKLLPFAQRHLSKTGVCLFPKGENYLLELDEAKKLFDFEYEVIQSLTDSKAKILKVHGIQNA